MIAATCFSVAGGLLLFMLVHSVVQTMADNVDLRAQEIIERIASIEHRLENDPSSVQSADG